jgi:Flp pilus assembly protein TadD
LAITTEETHKTNSCKKRMPFKKTMEPFACLHFSLRPVYAIRVKLKVQILRLGLAALFAACRAGRGETILPVPPAAEHAPEAVSPPPLSGAPAVGEDSPELPAAASAAVQGPFAQRGPSRAGQPLTLKDIRGRSGIGVFTGELDPVNYQTADPELLLRMGMEPYLVSFIMGERRFRAGNYEGALTEYNKAVALKPDFAEARFFRGRIYHERGDLDRAIADYTAVIKAKNDFAAAYNYRGCAYAQKGDQAGAIADYTRAIGLKEDYGDPWFNRGYSRRERGEYDEAVADFSKLIELEPDNAAAYNQRGTAWYYKGEDEKAIADFSQAIRLKRDFSLAWYNRGIVRRTLGDTGRAETDLAEAGRLGYGL